MKKLFLGGVMLAMLMTGCGSNSIFGTKPSLISSAEVRPAEAKLARATCYRLLFINWGKCTIGEAAEQYKLHKIQSVDYTKFSLLGIYSQSTVEVRGE